MSADISNLLSALSTHTALLPLLHTILTQLITSQTTFQSRLDTLQTRLQHLENLVHLLSASPTTQIPEIRNPIPEASPDDLTQPPPTLAPSPHPSPTRLPPPPPPQSTTAPRPPSTAPAKSHPSPSPRTPPPPSANSPQSPLSSRLRRTRRKSKRPRATLTSLYSDQENSPLQHNPSSPPPVSTPLKKPCQTRQPLAELTSAAARNNQTDAAEETPFKKPPQRSPTTPRALPTLHGFRTPAAVVRAVDAVRKERETRSEPRCQETVRGNARMGLKARACVECEEFLKEEIEGRGGDVHEELKRLVDKVCRHREKDGRPETPKEFYKLTFEETQTQAPQVEDGDGKEKGRGEVDA